jgi:hypothetical protein
MRKMIAIAAVFLATPVLAATITPQDAAQHAGEMTTVEGVAYVHVSEKASFLDIGAKYPDQPFEAVIFADHTKAFGDLTKYDGKTVDVTGRIRGYKGKPEIILTDPSQLKLKR